MQWSGQMMSTVTTFRAQSNTLVRSGCAPSVHPAVNGYLDIKPDGK